MLTALSSLRSAVESNMRRCHPRRPSNVGAIILLKPTNISNIPHDFPAPKDCNWPRRSASVARKSWSFVAQVLSISVSSLPVTTHDTIHTTCRSLTSCTPPKTNGWNLKITHLKRKIIFQTSIFRFHVSFWGCKASPYMNRSFFGNPHHSPGSREDHWKIYLSLWPKKTWEGICMCFVYMTNTLI